MIIKAVLLFLVVIGLLGMTGRFTRSKPQDRRGPEIQSARKCPKCGTYLVGSSPCVCGYDRDA